MELKFRTVVLRLSECDDSSLQQNLDMVSASFEKPENSIPNVNNQQVFLDKFILGLHNN